MLESILDTISGNPTYAKGAMVMAGLISLYVMFKFFKKLIKMFVIVFILAILVITGIMLTSKENPVDKIKQFINGGKATVSTIGETSEQLSEGMKVLQEYKAASKSSDQKLTKTQKQVEELLKKYEKKKK